MTSNSHIASGRTCIACTTCSAVCPAHCIDFRENERGFYAPYVDDALCINCGACLSRCPEDKPELTRELATAESRYFYLDDAEERSSSASGGAFYALALQTLSRGGMVCGCVWGEDFVARHVCTRDLEQVKKMRGSKYVQSDLGDSFVRIKEALSEKTPVLFCGTSCQATALCLYLSDDPFRDLLTCVALICGGVPSPKVWRLYKQGLESQKGSSLVSIEMRSKCGGWLLPHLRAQFEDGTVIREVLLSENHYGTLFGNGLFVNEPCMHCKYKLESVQADLLVGDCWGVTRRLLSETQDLGISSVIALTERGCDAIGSLQNVVSAPEDLGEIIATHHVLTKDHHPDARRDEFFDRVDSEDIMGLLSEMYGRRGSALKRGVNRFLFKTGLYEPVFKLRWRRRHR